MIVFASIINWLKKIGDTIYIFSKIDVKVRKEIENMF